MNTIKQCEVCGSDDIVFHEEYVTIKVDYGSMETYLSLTYECNECKSTLELPITEERYMAALERSLEHAIPVMVHIAKKENIVESVLKKLNIDLETLNSWGLTRSKPSFEQIQMLTDLIDDWDYQKNRRNDNG